MDFALSEEQRDIQGLARQILADLSTPARLAAFDNYAAERFDGDLWNRFAEAGLLGVAVPEELGGMGFGFMELTLLVEEVGRSIAALPAVPHLVGGMLPIALYGNDEQKQRLLPAAARGEIVLSAAPDDGYAGASITACATADGYRVSGEAFAVPFGGRAARVLLGARTEQGLVALLVDPSAAGASRTPIRTTTYEPQTLLRMEEVAVPAADVLAGPEAGAAVMDAVNRYLTVALCAHQLGVTDSMMRQTAAYTTERKQFGVPIATFQAVGHRAANCFIDVECLKLCTYQAASLLAAGENAAVEVDVAKIWAGDTGHRVSYAAQHLHGGAGVDRGNALWRYCLWARHNEMTLGSSAARLASLGARCASGEALVD